MYRICAQMFDESSLNEMALIISKYFTLIPTKVRAKRLIHKKHPHTTKKRKSRVSQLGCTNLNLKHFHAGDWEWMKRTSIIIDLVWQNEHLKSASCTCLSVLVSCSLLFFVAWIWSKFFVLINPMNFVQSRWTSIAIFQDPRGTLGNTNITHDLQKDHYYYQDYLQFTWHA